MDVTTLESRIYAARFFSSVPETVLNQALQQTASKMGLDNVKTAMDQIGMSESARFLTACSAKPQASVNNPESGINTEPGRTPSVNAKKWRP